MNQMVSQKASTIFGLLILLSIVTFVSAISECSAVTALVSTCSTFITYGSPDPFPGSQCCDAMVSLDLISDSIDNRRYICRCMMGVITTYNPNATAIATLPGFCGVSLGFTVDPNTDCNL